MSITVVWRVTSCSLVEQDGSNYLRNLSIHLPKCKATKSKTTYFWYSRSSKFQISHTFDFNQCRIKIDQLDVTCFISSLFNAQHVSNVSTSILRSFRLIFWVISWVVLLWYDVCCCYGVVRLGWCGILMQAEAVLHYSLLNKFRMLVHPSSGACDLLWIYFMCCFALVRCVLV